VDLLNAVLWNVTIIRADKEGRDAKRSSRIQAYLPTTILQDSLSAVAATNLILGTGGGLKLLF
jgi:hypothetical protein